MNVSELLTIPRLYQWLVKQKNPNRVFDYTDNRHCLLARYLRANLVNFNSSGVTDVTVNGKSYPVSSDLECIGLRCWKVANAGFEDRHLHRTYGNAIKYIEQCFSDQIKEPQVVSATRLKLKEIMTVDKIKGWLLKQHPSTGYIYSDGLDCLLARYLKSHDLHYYVDSIWIRDVTSERDHESNFRYPPELNEISHNSASFTYGGALLAIAYPQFRRVV